MDEDQVKGLMEVNDALKKAGTIDSAAHTRNKEAIVASFVEGLGPPLLEGQGGAFARAKSDANNKPKKRTRRHSVGEMEATKEAPPTSGMPIFSSPQIFDSCLGHKKKPRRVVSFNHRFFPSIKF